MNNTITFHIDAQVVDIFNLILAHTGENKETLFNNWRKSGINSQNFSPNPSSEKTEIIIDLSEISEREQGALFFFMDEVLKPSRWDSWFEGHIRSYCQKELNEMKKITALNYFIINTRTISNRQDNFPSEVRAYLEKRDHLRGTTTAYQYEQALKRVANYLRINFNKNFWDITDRKEIESYGYAVSNSATALKKYCEFLSEKEFNEDDVFSDNDDWFNTNNVRSNRGSRELTPRELHNLFVVALVFSHNWERELFPYYNQGEAAQKAADILKVRKSVLMTSTRDRFDTHVPDSGRNGWYQTELTPEMQEFLDEYLNKDKKEIIQEAREILGFV